MFPDQRNCCDDVSRRTSSERPRGLEVVERVLTGLAGTEENQKALALSLLTRFEDLADTVAGIDVLNRVLHVSYKDLLADPRWRQANAGGGGRTASVERLVAAMREVERIRFGALVGEGLGLNPFLRTPIFESVAYHAGTEPTPSGSLLGWVVRCGQWTWALEDPDHQLALVRLAGAFVATGNDLVGRCALRLGTRLLGEYPQHDRGAEEREVPIRDLLSAIEGIVPPSINEAVGQSLVVEALRALHAGKVVGSVRFLGTGLRSSLVVIGSALPQGRSRPSFPKNV